MQYIPVRKEVVDIIETQMDKTGELSNFGKGSTSPTLHFNRTSKEEVDPIPSKSDKV